MTPDIAVLTAVYYVPEKRQIVAQFSSEHGKVSERFKLLPKGFVSCTEKDAEILETVLAHYNPQRVSLSFPQPGVAQVETATFADLKKVAHLLNLSSGKIMSVVEPERQFLLEKGWRYFDTFLPTSRGMVFTPSYLLPDITTDFTPYPLIEFLETLLVREPQTAQHLLERMALSHFLHIPMTDMAQDPFFQGEWFLENMLFQHRLPLPTSSLPSPAQDVKRPVRGVFRELAEIDFANVWPAMFTHPFMNLGFESLDCSCCVPSDEHAQNLSPTSMVEVTFSRHECYFESVNRHWTTQVHTSQPGQQKRREKMEEWKLCSLPVGPFSYQQTAFIPLPDARLLQKKGILTIHPNYRDLHWFCRRKESSLSRTTHHLQQSLSLLQDMLQRQEQQSLSEHGILGEDMLTRSVQYQYHSALYHTGIELLHYLPLHLTNPHSRSYHPSIAQVIAVSQAEVMSQFRLFAEEKGAKFVASNHYRTFVETDAPLSLVKAFSASFSLPQPRVSQQHEAVLLG